MMNTCKVGNCRIYCDGNFLAKKNIDDISEEIEDYKFLFFLLEDCFVSHSGYIFDFDILELENKNPSKNDEIITSTLKFKKGRKINNNDVDYQKFFTPVESFRFSNILFFDQEIMDMIKKTPFGITTKIIDYTDHPFVVWKRNFRIFKSISLELIEELFISLYLRDIPKLNCINLYDVVSSVTDVRLFVNLCKKYFEHEFLIHCTQFINKCYKFICTGKLPLMDMRDLMSWIQNLNLKTVKAALVSLIPIDIDEFIRGFKSHLSHCSFVNSSLNSLSDIYKIFYFDVNDFNNLIPFLIENGINYKSKLKQNLLKDETLDKFLADRTFIEGIEMSLKYWKFFFIDVYFYLLLKIPKEEHDTEYSCYTRRFLFEKDKDLFLSHDVNQNLIPMKMMLIKYNNESKDVILKSLNSLSVLNSLPA